MRILFAMALILPQLSHGKMDPPSGPELRLEDGIQVAGFLGIGGKKNKKSRKALKKDIKECEARWNEANSGGDALTSAELKSCCKDFQTRRKRGTVTGGVLGGLIGAVTGGVIGAKTSKKKEAKAESEEAKPTPEEIEKARAAYEAAGARASEAALASLRATCADVFDADGSINDGVSRERKTTCARKAVQLHEQECLGFVKDGEGGKRRCRQAKREIEALHQKANPARTALFAAGGAVVGAGTGVALVAGIKGKVDKLWNEFGCKEVLGK